MHPQLWGPPPSPAALGRAQGFGSKSPPTTPSICPKHFRGKLGQELRAIGPTLPKLGEGAV